MASQSKSSAFFWASVLLPVVVAVGSTQVAYVTGEYPHVSPLAHIGIGLGILVGLLLFWGVEFSSLPKRIGAMCAYVVVALLVPYRAVMLFSTYFEADGMRFESIEDLRTYLFGASKDFLKIEIRDCAAKDRVQELARVMNEVIAARFAQRGQEGRFYEFGIGRPHECLGP